MTDEPKAPKTSVEKTIEQAEAVAALAKLAPFVRLMGPRGRKIADALTGAVDIVPEIRELASLPDRFNAALGDRGWIAYDRLDVNVMRRAIELTERGRVEDAEAALAAYYDADTLSRHLHAMLAIPACRPRMELLRLAATDHNEGRYHAVAPIVLAQIDGLVRDVAGQSLFMKTADMAAKLVLWDSVAGRVGGLPHLVRILSEGRWTTSATEIGTPFRHGILHGRDLGYANQLAAAKTWAALFALREWALRYARGEIGPPPIEPEPTLRDTLTKIMSVERERAAIKAWRARPPRGPFRSRDEVTPGSAEEAALRWLDAWRDKDYDGMATWTQVSRRLRSKGIAQSLDADFGFRDLTSFVIETVVEQAPSKTQITAVAEDGSARMTANLIFEDENGRPVVHGHRIGRWGVNDISALRQAPIAPEELS